MKMPLQVWIKEEKEPELGCGNTTITWSLPSLNHDSSELATIIAVEKFAVHEKHPVSADQFHRAYVVTAKTSNGFVDDTYVALNDEMPQIVCSYQQLIEESLKYTGVIR